VKVRLRFFAALREIVGCEEMEKDVSEGMTPDLILEELAVEHPKLQTYLKVVKIAINQEFADRHNPLTNDDEIAFLPPVSGG
jgi:molybdopterin converting factor subunit 1